MTGAINSGEVDMLLHSNQLPTLSPGDPGLLPIPGMPISGMPRPGMDPPPPPGWLPMPPSPSQFQIGVPGPSPTDGSRLFQLPADSQGARASADFQRPLWQGVLESAERLTQLLESARMQQPPLAETDMIAQIQSLVAVFVRVPLGPRSLPTYLLESACLEPPQMTSDDLYWPLITSEDL